MATYSATLLARVVARTRSEPEFRRRCARLLRRAGTDLQVEQWDLDELGVIPDVPRGKLLVYLCTLGNPDHGQYAPVSEPEWHVVASLPEAREQCVAYLTRYDGLIGAGNWGPRSGEVTNSGGAVVARFSYNLRCWSPTGTELACAWDAPAAAKKPKSFVVLGPDGIPIRAKPFASRKAAERGLQEFVARFRVQGYYAGVGYRLALGEIAARCTVTECGAGANPVPPLA